MNKALYRENNILNDFFVSDKSSGKLFKYASTLASSALCDISSAVYAIHLENGRAAQKRQPGVHKIPLLETFICVHPFLGRFNQNTIHPGMEDLAQPLQPPQSALNYGASPHPGYGPQLPGYGPQQPGHGRMPRGPGEIACCLVMVFCCIIVVTVPVVIFFAMRYRKS